MKQNLVLTIALALSTVTGFAQTAPPPSPPSRSTFPSSGTISGFTPNAVSGFTPGAVSGFSQNPVGGLTPLPRSTFPPGTIAPLSTSIGGASSNSMTTVPFNSNVIVVPQTRFQPPPVAPFPTNPTGTNRFLMTPLF